MDIVEFARKRRKEWNNHMEKADENRTIRIVRYLKSGGKRELGHPQRDGLNSSFQHQYKHLEAQGSENMAQHLPEIKDIYDSIYGIVQSKLEFYENKKQQRGSRPSTPVRTISFDYSNLENNYRKISKNEDAPVAGSLDSSLKSRGKELFINVDLPTPKMKESVSPIPVPIVRKTIRETTENPDLLNGVQHTVYQVPYCKFG
ncbi:hypothetical protein FQA39_LY19082 [Lamprigera yunnana]|nr:hypothetical protein FQA39_LY19082 [Lamprigera yunnana]